MKLTELFTNEKQITDGGKSQPNTAKSDVINRQIRSMVPGQTVQGEVVAKNGGEVQIRVADDFILQARLEQSMNLEIGKNMTFEVKNNGKALTLSPLFTNVATDANVLKALDMASLPVNDTTVAIAKQLMAAGLSINRNALQQVYREVNMFPKSEVADIVNLHKLQMPVNESNVTQMASYRNLTHQLVTGLNNVLEAVPDMFAHMMDTGNADGAVKLYQQLVLMANEAPMTDGTPMASGAPMADGTNLLNVAQTGDGNAVTGFPTGELAKAVITENVIINNVITEAGGTQTVVTEGVLQEAAAMEEGAIEGAKAPENPIPALGAQQPEETVLSAQQFANLLGRISAGAGGQELLTQLNQMWKEIGGDKEFIKPLLQLLKNQWTITPEEVANAENVEKLYSRINRQLKDLAQTLENTGQNATASFKAITNLSQNLDFMQQINQMYTYVQLPLRLQQGEAHGDLYVYTNKKHLAANDGQISALLHLDMENLGPVDVYVTMMQSNVKTQFYLKDDEMLDFLMDHMDILTERLKKRGYQCSFEMQVRKQEEESKSSIQKVLLQENHVPLAEYAFDVRT